jgi:hypothetical protein
LPTGFVLAEIKGLRASSGGIRLTKNEYQKAVEYTRNYALVVVSDLDEIPKLNPIFNPAKELNFEMKTQRSEQIYYTSDIHL